MTLTKVRDRGTTGISTDLQPIKSDISALALREATTKVLQVLTCLTNILILLQQIL